MNQPEGVFDSQSFVKMEYNQFIIQFKERIMAAQKYFQWQNDILLKDIYPMRLVKLRDVLVFFKEADL